MQTNSDLSKPRQHLLIHKKGGNVLTGIAMTLSLLLASPAALSSIGPASTPTSIRQASLPTDGSPYTTARSLSTLETQVIHSVNRIRRKRGLRPLRYNPTLVGVARRHSHNMLKNWFFSHADQHGHTVVDRVQRTRMPVHMVAENLAWTSNAPDPVATAVQSWVNSPGHLRNILEPRLQETGVGIARQGGEYFFTQVFIRRP